ncbi:Long-chain-fatty-acid--CoA ligase [compost metagenome]
MSLFALIHDRLASAPETPVLIVPEGPSYTGMQLLEQASRYAAFLSGLGVAKGDRVAVQVAKSPEALILYMACLQAGFVFMPMNTAYLDDEVDFLLGDAEPAAFIHRPETEAKSRAIAERRGVKHAFSLGEAGEGTFPQAASEAPAAFEAVPCADDDLAAMLYTSGTTGKPKGAMLTQANLASNALALVEAWRFTAEDVLLHALPIFHTHGLFVATHCALLSGARMLWLPRFEREAVMSLLSEATVFMGVPTYYTRLLAGEDFGREACRKLRLFVSGSAPLLAETHREFEERTGHVILERYGMTETGMNTGNPYEGPRVPGSVGKPFRGIAIRVVNEDGVEVPQGEVGEIQVKGPNVMKAYWRLPSKTAAEFTADGYFKTGDVGRIDERGTLSIVGRAKDMIISGGFNVYPKEIEALIDALPGVGESAVVGLPHPDFGEVGLAVVTSDGALSEEAILASLKGRLANYKVPKRVVFADELPRNAMGKVQKNLLRDRYRDL